MRLTLPLRISNTSGFTLIELLVVVAVVGVVAAIATPGLLRSRIAANEASAIASMRVIASAQQDYAAGSDGFAGSLETLAGACPGSEVPFISPDLGANGVEKSGYQFTVTAGEDAVEGPSDCFGNPTISNYYASAAPAAIHGTGNRGFATNSASAIWQDTSGAVPEEPFEVTDTVTPLGKNY
jgi:type IV pilus assembly protein PilA